MLWKITLIVPIIRILAMIQNPSITSKNLAQEHAHSSKTVTDPQTILSIIDKSLKHLNQISQANIIAQELYIQLLKQKKTMKFDQIKKIYFTLTEGKAKQVLFERDKKELIQTDYQNHEGLMRLCWRSIEKLIKKITYYMINQNHLGVISKSILKLIHLNQQFVRRFHKLKNSSMLFIIQIMQKLIEENSVLQKKIYDILLNRGYVVSLDEFYKLNGYQSQHKDNYYAKPQPQPQNSSSEEEIQNKIQPQKKPSSQNSRKQTLRKKKGLRMDCRYSWKEKVQIEQKQDKEVCPANKTNFQIRQSFEKFIGDFLQNQSLNEILTNITFEDENDKKQEQVKKKSQKVLSEESVLQKKIFQSKIQSVLSQLKSNNVKVSSRLLQIIDNSSNQAISTKINLTQKFAQRKNSERRQSGLVAQRKLRQSYIINDRKIVNENFFRQLLRRNTTIQQFINQEIMIDAQKIKAELDSFQKVNPNIIQFSKKQHNQNPTTKPSRFSKQGKAVFMFNNYHVKPNVANESLKTIKSSCRYLETELNCKYRIESKKNIAELKHAESVTEKIRIIKEEWELKNEKNILEAIQNSALDPSNPLRLAEILQVLNKQKDLKLNAGDDPFQNLIESLSANPSQRGYRRLNTEGNDAANLNIQNITNESLNGPKSFIRSKLLNRIKTEQSPRVFSNSSKFFLQSGKQNQKTYEVYDRRLRRFVRR